MSMVRCVDCRCVNCCSSFNFKTVTEFKPDGSDSDIPTVLNVFHIFFSNSIETDNDTDTSVIQSTE